MRSVHRHALVLNRNGKPDYHALSPRRHDVRSVFFASVGRHSEKPEAFDALVEGLCRGPYAEVFARRRRAGWQSYGDELPEARA